MDHVSKQIKVFLLLFLQKKKTLPSLALLLFKHANHLNSAHHNVSDRISPRSRRPAHGCTDTSGQTWLTAARPETYQNLIYSFNDRNAPSHPLRRARTLNGNSKNPACAGSYDAPNLLFHRDVSIPKRSTPKPLVEANGIEPMTSCLQSRRSPS